MPMMIVALVSGLLFGAGLVVSGMIDPAKVLAFLDVAGNWDPSLAFVMGTAIPIAMIGFRAARRCERPVCGDRFAAPTKSGLDARLALGAVLFGAGWGLVGYCPGPALAALSYGDPATWLFVVAMVAGMGAHSLPALRRTEQRSKA
ncbi:YeeE/YedE family protein [Skermanella mucosa]|uniref:YeeE/YedE family protein n=1 Tax=Skermanella mucosa TaxID=1789672 RepID=UPI001E657B39|nr:YeeE/YedE family protein [Skermanella mucosa]UEM23818.1 YeeE/YedE family protein [Skermanella mucosa]